MNVGSTRTSLWNSCVSEYKRISKKVPPKNIIAQVYTGYCISGNVSYYKYTLIFMCICMHIIAFVCSKLKYILYAIIRSKLRPKKWSNMHDSILLRYKQNLFLLEHTFATQCIGPPTVYAIYLQVYISIT